MTEEETVDASCWNCGAPATSARIAAETVIRGRPEAEGGPYHVFRCPACDVENGVLRGPGGGRMLYPLSGLEPPSVLDRILSRREQRRLERSRVWWRHHRADVERFRRGEGDPRAPRPAPPPPPPPSPRTARRPSPVTAKASAPPPPRPPRPVRRPATSGPRAVLGVPVDATPDEVRRAFRRLAKRHHPDRAAADPKAAGRFREIRAAYEELMRQMG